MSLLSPPFRRPVRAAGIVPLLALFPGCFLLPLDSAAPESSPPDADPLTVATLRASPAEGQAAELTVVVQSGIFLDGSSVYVADAVGGPRSGLRLWSDERYSYRPEPGEIVEVSGTYTLVDGMEALVLPAGTLRELGAGDPVPPEGLPEDWNLVESGLVELSDVTVVGVDGAGVAELDAGMRVDPALYPANLRCRQALSRARGLLALTATGWALRPRDAADLELGPVPERLVSDVAAVQAGDCGPVQLKAVASTDAMMLEGEAGFFVQSGSAGLRVVSGGTGAPARGDTVVLQGEVFEEGHHTRLRLSGWESGLAAPVTATPLDAPAPDWAVWDGALLTLGPLILNGTPHAGFSSTDWGIGLTDLLHPSLFEEEATQWTDGLRLEAVSGVVVEHQGRWALAPRDNADLAR